MAAKMELISIDFSPDTPASQLNYVGHVSGYEGLGGGGEVQYNQAGKLKVYLLAGSGEGEQVWGGEVSRDVSQAELEKAQSDYLKDQEVRELMGIAPETYHAF